MKIYTDGGPAFPCEVVPKFDGMVYDGMSLRDYFAAKAMAAILGHLSEGIKPQDIIVMSEDAYMIADGMLAAREAK